MTTPDRVGSLKQRCFPKGIRRWVRSTSARATRRTGRRALCAAFRTLGIPDGAIVCVHASLSGFGYLAEGPESVIQALIDAVPGCTAMMPSFPFAGSALEYVRSASTFDYRSTPSASGTLSDVFWRMPGARRSCHPTHPCAALGPRSAMLIAGAEDSVTPFGDGSPYGRLSRSPEAFLLLLHTNSTSYVHRLQEMVAWPNLFLEDRMCAAATRPDGSVAASAVAVHRPTLPLYVAVNRSRDGWDYVWMPDYVVQFPGATRDRLLGGPPGARVLPERHATLLSVGCVREARLGAGEILLIDVAKWQGRVGEWLRESLETFPEAYGIEELEAARAAGRLRAH